ncbi:MAG TPA: helix-turn-helix transcriptional regulator [Terriglobia bacterium]|nr:helix-turn-helix transcriptional regulator [Terriglobia bacterium]
MATSRSCAVSQYAAIDPRIGRVVSRMQGGMHQKLTLPELAKETGLSVSRLCHVFGSEVGTSARQYLKMARLGRAKELLETSNLSVKQIAGDVGFEDVSRLIRHFRNMYGVTPSRYRRAPLRKQPRIDDRLMTTDRDAARNTYE